MEDENLSSQVGQVEMIRRLAAGDQDGRRQRRSRDWPHPRVTDRQGRCTETGGRRESRKH